LRAFLCSVEETSVKTQQIEALFERYLMAFKAYDLDGVVACYNLPCTLHTPDKIVLVNSIDNCKQEFNDIFTQLKQGNTAKIIARRASYLSITDNLSLACVDWDFINEQGEVFADFCAYYHMVESEDKQKLKIINVVSHELSNSLSLSIPFSIIS